MARVSIGIPAYNNEAGVDRLLESIRQQKYRDYEVVITDDSDDDRIGKRVKGYEGVRYYKNAAKLGATGNWNEAMRRCNGEYMKMMHHDDWFASQDSLGEFVRLMDGNPKADMVFCGTRQVGEGKSYERFASPEDVELIRQDYRNLYLGNTIGAPSAVMHRRGAGEYDETLTWLVDMDFYMGILRQNPYFAYTEKALVCIGVSDNQLTESCIRDQEINVLEYGYIYKKYDLGKEKQYREKLTRMLTDYGAGYGKAAELGITKTEYAVRKAGKFADKIKWKLKHGL